MYKTLTALTVAALLMAVILPGCGVNPGQTPDQCLRREIFKECMAALPKGPQSTVYNDWAEVVAECSTAATIQSMRDQSVIAPTCQ